MFDSLENEGPANMSVSPLYNRKEGMITKKDRETQQYLDTAATLSNSCRDYNRQSQLRKRS